jgi:hypothetical protein
MGTISRKVQHRMEGFPEKEMRLDELTQPGWGDAANYFGERDMKSETAELQVAEDVNQQIDRIVATPSPITIGEHMQTLEVVSGKSLMPAVTSRPGSSHMKLGSEKPQSHQFIPLFSPVAEHNSTPILDMKPAEPLRMYPCINHH